ncbi:uncharacterized protein [Lolium perenne]|uniref:uncharacterized protein n=1 Tax=Lolium perenne TaxID=4522 RepID=UPI0021F512F4|nr:uncharacterized protein LOC127305450 [Lolium perenne]
MMMASTDVHVLVTPASDLAMILASMHGMQVVSEDGYRVKCEQPFKEPDLEELQKKNVNDVKLLTLSSSPILSSSTTLTRRPSRDQSLPILSIIDARTATFPRSTAFEDHT